MANHGDIANVRQRSKSDSTVSSAANMSRNDVAMKRQISLFNSITIIIGCIIGSGIFIFPKGVLQYSGSVGNALIVWILCGVIATLGGICYAELGSSIKKGGGEYTYIKEAFGKFPAFLMLWVNFVILIPGGAAIIAQTFAIYSIAPFYPDCDPPALAVTLVAEACLILVYSYNCYSVRGVTSIQDIFTIGKIAGLGIIICGGIAFLVMGRTENIEDPFTGPGTNIFRLSLAFYNGLFAYIGWSNMNNMAEEIINPHRNFPIAIISSMLIITIIYVLTNVSYFTILSPQELLSSNAVAVTWGDKILGSASWLIPITVALSTFGSLNGGVLANSRYVYVGARDGLLPTLLSMIHTKFLTPMPSLIVTMVITCTLCLYKDTGSLVTYIGFSYWLFVGIVTTGLLWLRYKQPNLHRPFKVPIAIPILFALICYFLVVLSIFVAPLEAAIGTIIILTGIPVYIYAVMWKSKPALLRRFLDEMMMFFQRLMNVVQQEVETY
ncbi:large neutral amino acids transporter small subunit 1-like [Saccoglossus kowalevskii]|uniref:Large neutral amino acids transporter small subunit 1-like n=1 Tax=Saccoglossus kowalevskii TaxID=10224 RepID=A0ABM0GJ97_SACKO|nr:PREDICTED: large neutral amino acids transporter small subunit 1-like [Saccoglossus kowalevskii]